jgi:hypothetical protein
VALTIRMDGSVVRERLTDMSVMIAHLMVQGFCTVYMRYIKATVAVPAFLIEMKWDARIGLHCVTRVRECVVDNHGLYVLRDRFKDELVTQPAHQLVVIFLSCV